MRKLRACRKRSTSTARSLQRSISASVRSVSSRLKTFVSVLVWLFCRYQVSAIFRCETCCDFDKCVSCEVVMSSMPEQAATLGDAQACCTRLDAIFLAWRQEPMPWPFAGKPCRCPLDCPLDPFGERTCTTRRPIGAPARRGLHPVGIS